MGKYFLLECYDKVSELGVDVQIIGNAFIPCCCIGVPRDYVRYNLTPKISSLAVRSLACELRFYGVRGVEIFIVLQHAPLEAKELTYKCTYLLSTSKSSSAYLYLYLQGCSYILLIELKHNNLYENSL